MLENNNLSRKLFAEFLVRNKLERPSKRDSRNVVKVDTQYWAFTLGDSDNKCRQFYDDCDAIYVYGKGTVRREDCVVGAVTRITPNGMKARNADYSNALINISIFN